MRKSLPPERGKEKSPAGGKWSVLCDRQLPPIHTTPHHICTLIPNHKRYTVAFLTPTKMTSMKIMSLQSSPTQAQRLSRAVSKTLIVSGLLGALFAAPAWADEQADVSKLLRAGQLAQAITKADAFLAQKPRDAQMRFLKGVILTEQNKPAEAIALFTKLTEDFPDLPEPYNNLAVLYASSGQFEKARAALDMAIRTNPSYATAYENLGDVHAKMASQAYDKALQLDSSNTAAKSKLTLLRSLAGNASGGVGAKPAAVASTPIAVTKVAPAPAPTPAAVAQIITTRPQPVKTEAKPAVVASNDNSEDDEVIGVVHHWAKAWSAQDVKTYLNFYGSDFQTPNGESRKSWADERQSRISGKGRISVKVETPQVKVSGNTATVKFRQIYESDRLQANSRKTLVLIKQGGKWQIKQERTGN
jgi:tetratricopeptide (TPR) repeat protein